MSLWVYKTLRFPEERLGCMKACLLFSTLSASLLILLTSANIGTMKIQCNRLGKHCYVITTKSWGDISVWKILKCTSSVQLVGLREQEKLWSEKAPSEDRRNKRICLLTAGLHRSFLSCREMRLCWWKLVSNYLQVNPGYQLSVEPLSDFLIMYF